MTLYLIKLTLSALIIVVVSEVAKRSGVLGGLLASLPLVSILSLTWLYLETRDAQAISNLSYSILGFILPSLILFLMLPFLLKKGIPFAQAMLFSCLITMLAYGAFFFALRKLGISI